MNSGSPLPIPPNSFKDRRAGLIFFGALAIGVGGLCALLVPLLLAAFFLMPPSATGLNWRTMVTGIMAYSAMAGVLVSLGIGSMLCRRWARTLLLIVAWAWLLAGVLILGFLLWAALALAPDKTADMMIGIALFLTVVFSVVLPGVMVLFYQNRDVKATCEARHPAPDWTDGCPEPVLANSLGLGVGSLWLLTAPVTNDSVVPVFGYLLSGAIASLIIVICSAAGLYLAWTTYRRKLSGWWGCLAAFAVASVSAAVTFTRVDLMEFYRQSGYSEEQVAQISSLGFFTGRMMAWAIMIFFLFYLVFLLWIRKYFGRTVEIRA